VTARASSDALDHQERKREQVERYLRAADNFVGYEEQKRRKTEARLRRGAERPRGSRRRDFSLGEDEWDDEVSFEKIGRRSSGAPRGAGIARPLGDGLPRAAVAAVHRGRVELEGDRPARLAGSLAADPNLQIVVGDEVAYTETGGVARIEGILPRRSSLVRADPGATGRELALAANVDVAVIVAAAADPPLRPGLVDRFLIGLERGHVAPAICVNKVDLLTLDAERAALDAMLAPYAELAVPVFKCSATTRAGLPELVAHLEGKTCVFVGHSGVGKSSLLDAIDPEGERAIGGLRAHDGRGRHTTSSSSLRAIGAGTRVIDTPGVRAFGLEHLEPAQIRAGFPDLGAFASGCRFQDCTHVHEPDCAVRDAIEDGELSRARYASYLRVLEAG